MELYHCYYLDDDRTFYSHCTCKFDKKVDWTIDLSDLGFPFLYISLGKVAGGTAPILDGNPGTLYSNPLPHVLILTAIVVGVATTALGLALILRINEAFGSIEEDEIIAAKLNQSLARLNAQLMRLPNDGKRYFYKFTGIAGCGSVTAGPD